MTPEKNNRDGRIITRQKMLEKVRKNLENGLKQGKTSMEFYLEDAPERFNFINIGYAILELSNNGTAKYELRRYR